LIWKHCPAGLKTFPICFSYPVSAALNLYVRGENLTDNRQMQNLGRDMPEAAFYGGFKWLIL